MGKYIGEEFEDRDSRAFTRVIRIIDYARSKNGNIKFSFFGIGNSPKYIAEVTYHQLKPHLRGRRNTVSEKTLDTRYVKISH